MSETLAEVLKPETLMDALDSRLPKDCVILEEGPSGQSIVRKAPEEQRLLISIHRRDSNRRTPNNYSSISFRDSNNIISLISKDHEQLVILNLDRRMPLSKEERQEYVDLVKAYLYPFD